MASCFPSKAASRGWAQCDGSHFMLPASAAHPLRSEAAALRRWLFYVALSLCTFPAALP